MGKIHILEKQVAELIAAGEVVERPASVVKELTENSVDAGSEAVTVEIRNGGITYLRVTDNGCGIAREDVPAAFLRHATSKISGRDDLDGIATLGFRGEALASIAAVARVDLLTRTAEELAGTHCVLSEEMEPVCEDAGCAEGTTLVVRDLFYNTPARMKFLKKDSTEGNAIAAVIDRVALSHPEVSFRFLRDGREALHTPGDGKLKSAVYAVFGKEFTAGLLPVDYELGGVRVTGFVSKPAAARPNRSMQYFFINGRSVRSRTAAVSLEEAFRGSLMVGKLPACVLYLSIPCSAVDVNVHPSKMEVRFVNEKPVFDAVYHGVKTALNQGDTPPLLALNRPEPAVLPVSAPVKQMQFADREAVARPVPAASFSNPAERYMVHDSKTDAFSVPREEMQAEVAPVPAYREEISVVPVEEKPMPTESIPETPEEKPERLIGEAFATYLILERGDELVFLDKHAAHERLLYEKLKAEAGKADRQMLLEPVPVTLDKNEYSAVLDSLELFADAGFEVEDFGSGTVLVRSVPMILGGGSAAEALMEMAGYLVSSKSDLTTEKLDWLYHNVACRAAVKAGDESSPAELYALAKRVEQEDVRYCPHGRPVFFILKRKELERQMGRIQ
jgi:DNA mismatch repair protein MutL